MSISPLAGTQTVPFLFCQAVMSTRDPRYVAIWGGLTFALLLVLLRQIAVLNGLRKLEADAMMIDRLTAHLDLLQQFYQPFCENAFELDPQRMPEDLRRSALTLVRDFARVGILFRSGAFHRRLVLNLHSDICIRAWLILEPYIRLEREQRHNASWNWAMQYLTVLSLKYHLESSQGELVVFDPRNASNFKTYNSDDLGRMLNKVQVELRRIEPATRIRRILRSVESAILLLSLKRRRRDFDEFKYRAALERIEDLQLPTELRKRINLIKKECGVQ